MVDIFAKLSLGPDATVLTADLQRILKTFICDGKAAAKHSDLHDAIKLVYNAIVLSMQALQYGT